MVTVKLREGQGKRLHAVQQNGWTIRRGSYKPDATKRRRVWMIDAIKKLGRGRKTLATTLYESQIFAAALEKVLREIESIESIASLQPTEATDAAK